MIKSYTAFRFNGETFSDFINVTLNNEFYSDNLRGSRSIIEDKIPGRDIPYFYEVDDAPLELDLTFAVEEPKTKSDIKTFVKALISSREYRTLEFGTNNGTFERLTPTFKVIFIDIPTIEYIAAKDDKYYAYFTLKARCDRPYGYIVQTTTTLSTTHTNLGDLFIIPTLVITASATTASITFAQGSDSNTISFTGIGIGEVITYNGKLNTIKTNSGNNVYPNWNTVVPILYSGTNTITLTGCSATISYETPSYF